MIIKKVNKKKIIIISSIILLLFLITILLLKNNQNKIQQQYIHQEQQRVKKYTSLENFKTLEEVALYLNSKFIKQENSDKENIDFNIYMELAVKIQEGAKINKEFYNKLIQYTAFVLKYKNFTIVDEKNEIIIVVICEEQEQLVGKYYINGIENYFEVKETENNVEKIVEITPIKIDIISKELKQIVLANWNANNINLGTKESTYRGYDIYFDEGYEVKNVNRKIFNIVFTEKYQENIVNNINTKTQKEDIEKMLGKPHFESGNLIGYKAENMYLFFCENQISIYRIEEYETEEIAKIIQKYKDCGDIEEYVNTVKQEWKDYDIYEYEENYVKLQYTLKGLCIKYDSLAKRGTILYNNYKGKVLRKYNFGRFYK